MSKRNQQLRRQIHESVAAPALSIEKRIADSLTAQGEFHENIDSLELGLILRKVVHTLVGKQKVASFDVPIVHNVSQMDARMVGGEARVECEVHIHQPIIAFIRFKYTLENDPRSCGQKLRLKNDHVEVREITRPLDVGAKLALRMLRVEHIARHELSDPGGIIMRTLPDQLELLGYAGDLFGIELEFNGDNTLRVHIVGESERFLEDDADITE